MKKITIYDIAKACQCSPATVSLALNNDPRINKKTRQLILETSRKLEYQVNYFGRGLITRKSNTIKMAIPDIVNPVFSNMIEGVENYLKNTRYHLLLDITYSDETHECESVLNLLDNKIDGLIISPMFEKSLTEYIMSNNIDQNKIVYIGLPCKTSPDIHYVETNSHLGAYSGVSHLIEQGCRRIAFLAPTRLLVQGQRRLNGYRDALRDHGIPFDESLVFRCSQQFDDIFNCAIELLKTAKPDGVFCLYDYAAIPLMRAASILKVDIPHEVKIVGYDNIELGNYLERSLSTIETYQRKQGEIAAETLLALLEGETRPISTVIDPALIVRESSM